MVSSSLIFSIDFFLKGGFLKAVELNYIGVFV